MWNYSENKIMIILCSKNLICAKATTNEKVVKQHENIFFNLMNNGTLICNTLEIIISCLLVFYNDCQILFVKQYG